jgi:hypothetical protein
MIRTSVHDLKPKIDSLGNADSIDAEAGSYLCPKVCNETRAGRTNRNDFHECDHEVMWLFMVGSVHCVLYVDMLVVLSAN